MSEKPPSEKRYNLAFAGVVALGIVAVSLISTLGTVIIWHPDRVLDLDFVSGILLACIGGIVTLAAVHSRR